MPVKTVTRDYAIKISVQCNKYSETVYLKSYNYIQLQLKRLRTPHMLLGSQIPGLNSY